MRQSIMRTGLGLCPMLALATVQLTGQEQQHPPGQPTAEAATPLYDNLGTLHKDITTESEVAQKYFDQGLRLIYAFNHDEAIKSFREVWKV